MDKETSIYLDAVRFLAALAIVACHVGEAWIGGGFLWRFSSLGSVPVIVFFVLSGYVIDYATHARESDYTSFLLARASRIGSVAIPALALTALLDTVGRSVDPSMYAWCSMSWQSLAADLTFLNEAWGIHKTFGSNSPYWSMGFEVPFYTLYGIEVFSSGRSRAIMLGAAMLLFGPGIIVFFPMWVLGSLSVILCAGITNAKGAYYAEQSQ